MKDTLQSLAELDKARIIAREASCQLFSPHPHSLLTPVLLSMGSWVRMCLPMSKLWQHGDPLQEKLRMMRDGGTKAWIRPPCNVQSQSTGT